jgi:hypothetical protein
MSVNVEFDMETTDPVALAAMFNQMESGVMPDPIEDKNSDDAVIDIATKVDTPAVKQEAEKDPDGIATKDGKHIIPYSVLQADRERARRAEEALAESQRKLADLEAAAKSGQGVKDGEAAAPNQADDLSAEDLETLKEDFPTVYKGIMAMKKQAEMLEAQLKPVQATVQQQEQDAQRTQADLVQEAIDATPKLAHIKAQDPEAFALAAQFDNTLKASPQWAGKTLEERFAKVIEMVESANGVINVPGQSTQSSSQKTAEQLKTEAKAIAAAQAKATKTNVPTSLSDFPAGQHAAADDREQIESMTTLQIAQKFAGMTADHQEAYLNNL